jgi:non-specific protein-tyrosine kinase
VEPTEPVQLGFREYLRVMARRRRTIAFAVVVVCTVALASAFLQTPQYASTASLLIKPNTTATLLNPNANASSDPVRDLQTQIQVVTSQPVRGAVQAILGAAPTITVAPLGQANVVAITAQSTDAATAATVANTYANAYINYRRTQDLNDALAAESQIQNRIGDLERQIDGLNNQIKTAPAAVAATLAPQVDGLLQQKGTFVNQLGQLQVDAALTSGGAQIVSPASVPRSPISPRPSRDLVLAIFAGFMLGVAAVFALEYFDDSLKSREDLDRAVPGVTNLGLIPKVPNWKVKSQPMVVSLDDSKSPTAEAFRALRTALQFIALDRPLKLVQVTSPSAAEGKTTVIANLGVALAQVGQRVVIACCDLRRPRLHEFFALDNSLGFTSVVLGELPASLALQDVKGVPNLKVMASGPPPPNPSELLASHRAAEVFTVLAGEADIVLVDCPPVLPVTDAAVLSRIMDGTLLVVTAGSTTRKQATRAMQVLNQVDAPVLGTVLNGVTSEGSYGYGYGNYRYERPDSRAPIRLRPSVLKPSRDSNMEVRS